MKSKNGQCRMIGFLRRNGVYLALAISLLMVGAVVIAGLTRRLAKSEDHSMNAQQQVEQKVTGQKDTRTTLATTTTTALTSKSTTTTTGTKAPALYLHPISNTVQKAFSADAPVFCQTMQDWRLHLGTDFAGDEGQAVKAVTGGKVVTVTTSSLWGGVIEIDHGVGVTTRYCGVKAIVRVGDVVEMGEHIGDLQTIPCECAQSPHLHLEMWVDGVPVDPVAAIALDVRYADTIH